MKTKEELIALKNEFEALNARLAQLTDEELAQVAGGLGSGEAASFGKKKPPLVVDATAGDKRRPPLPL